MREVGAADARATVDPIAADGDVVGGGAPAEVDLGRAGGGGGQRAGRRGRLVVDGLGRPTGGVAVGAGVVGGVDRPHLVAVAGRGRETRVLVAGGGAVAGRPDLAEVAAASALAAPDLVVGDADVVGRRTPAEVDLGRADGGGGQRAGRRGRGRVRRATDPGGHIGLDGGGREGAVVDADVVEQAVEELAVEGVATERERVSGAGDRA